MADRLDFALAQLDLRPRAPEANTEKIAEVVAAHRGVGLVVFPELFLSGYTTMGLERVAVDLRGPELARVAEIARDHSTGIVVGAPVRYGAGYANSAVHVDRNGSIAGFYHKTHLFGDERRAFRPGERLLVGEVEGLKVGFMVCFDVEFPEVARALARGGADLLLTISANMHPFGEDHGIFGRARALENGLPHVYVNGVGVGGEFEFVGGSMVVSADGELLADAGPGQEVVIEASVPVRGSSIRPDYLRQTRPPLQVVDESYHLVDGEG